ncbi:MAG: PEGA domain-containing protein, partial [Sandaracinaceae bacterium]
AHVVEVSAADDSVSGRREVVLAADEIREVRFEGGAPPRGRLRVLSSPGGATVRIDGALAGTTPLEAYVAPGRHEVRASLDGFEDAEDEVELSGPEETAVLSFALTAEPRDRAPPERPRGAGVLMISTTPWSEVYLGGRHLGTTPLANVRLPAGRHVLSLRHPGRPARRHPVSIRAGRTTRVRLAL